MPGDGSSVEAGVVAALGQRWGVDGGVALAAGVGAVVVNLARAHLRSDEDLMGSESVPAWAVGGGAFDPAVAPAHQ